MSGGAPGQSQPKWVPSSPGVDVDGFWNVIEMPGVIVHFWAPWNPYDKQLDANLQQVMPMWGKKFRFFSVNADETAFEEVIERFHVGALPALVCFKNGKACGRFHGVETVEQLEAFLTEMVEMRGR